jgi:alanine dehydrogenase
MDLAMHYLPDAKTQEQTIEFGLVEQPVTVGLVKGDRPIPDVVLFTPEMVGKLCEQGVRVFVQRDYAAHTSYTNMNYADAGAEIMDDFYSLVEVSKILVKFSPFTDAELNLLKEEQIIISRVIMNELTQQYINLLKEKRAYAIAINLITDKDNWSELDNILMSSANAEIMNKRLGMFIMPLLEAVLFSKNFRVVVQTNPALLQSVFCFKGILCNRLIAEHLDMMWKDILSLCFDLN